MSKHNPVSIILRPLSPADDMAAVEALLAPCRAATGQALSAELGRTLLLLDGGRMAGIAVYGPSRRPEDAGWSEVEALYLLPAYRGRGLGRWMLSASLRDMTSLGAEKVCLYLPADSADGAFFRQMGFVPVGDGPLVRHECFPGRGPRLRERCCGAAIFARRDGKVLWLTETTCKGHTALCKGHMEPGEDEHATALREIREETGLAVSFLGDFREISRYSTFPDRVKTVTFFLAETKSTDAVPQPEEVRWVHFLPFDLALDSLTYADDRRILTAARDCLAAMEPRQSY